ncbi:uncharacterized protein GGS22DRAFT_195974 [Annulohypoxylon maeteangense]|uniref:uncharacterized protein n=1 Tax=Annulohypoxylon maeteangense TaxID=1927788 RepID=UPI002007E1C1|nr:uncharacterized protein GGS22DRAFT_195974 [Annulohypoxylon maeteangense]KAI0882235.1 hypothetical protein GGS22DRAFT_195974 [Annulohypoxylon maeteangense]
MPKTSALAVLVLAASTQTLAQDLKQTIVGCVELECPPSSKDTANDNCTIADTGSFPYVGLTRISSNSSSPLSSLSWVKGVNITSSSTSTVPRTFHSSFFLGAPPTLSVNASSSATGACAVFLRGAEAWDMAFGEEVVKETAQGTCADAMGVSCVDALVGRAKERIEGYYGGSGDVPASNADACERLRRDLLNSTLDACMAVSRGSWTNFTAVALTGNDGPEPISQRENSSTTCWPITPKKDSLSLVAEFTQVGSDLVADAEKAFWAITPILTIFFPIGNGTATDTIDASLSCVKAMGPARASVDTMNNGTDDQDNGVISLLSSNLSATVISKSSTVEVVSPLGSNPQFAE